MLLQFNFQYADSGNKPQPIPLKAILNQSVGGNATENRTLLPLFPITYGFYITTDDKC